MAEEKKNTNVIAMIERKRFINAQGGTLYPGVKGQRPHGRKKGVPNKMTRQIKEAIVEAAESWGEDSKGKEKLVGFFRYVIKKDLYAFCNLIGRAMPLQLLHKSDGTTEVTNYETTDEVREEMRQRGLPDDITIYGQLIDEPEEPTD